MAPFQSLVVYRSITRPKLIRAVFVYRWNDGYEEDEERAYLFHKEKNYEEIYLGRLFTANNFNVHDHYEGRRNGLWVCLMTFDGGIKYYNDVATIPRILNVDRNRKLQAIPSLHVQLQFIFHLASMYCGWPDWYVPLGPTVYVNDLSAPQNVIERENLPSHQLQTPNLSTGIDLNSIPPESDNEGNDQNGSG